MEPRAPERGRGARAPERGPGATRSGKRPWSHALRKEALEPRCGRNNPANQGLLPLGTGRGVPSGGARAWRAEKRTEMGLWDGSVSLEEGPFDPSASWVLRFSAGPAVEKLLRFGDKRRLALTWRGWRSSFQFAFRFPKYTC